MKNASLKSTILITAIIFLATGGGKDRLANDFVAPPENFLTGAFWYWMNGHITKEGVVNDLKAMKKAGINWVLLGSDIVSGNDFGSVKLFSPEWYEAIHTTLKTATELDIEVGLFNCPGWSQAGGPWIKPENSMRYLTFSETRIKGPAKVEQQLPQPTEHFQDVKVLAVPVASGYMDNLLKDANVKLTYSNNVERDTGQIRLPVGESSIEIRLPEEKSTRSLVIYPVRGFNSAIEFQVKEGENYRTIKQFTLDRIAGHGMLLSLGYEPYAPAEVSFAEVKSDVYRIIFRTKGNDSDIKFIVLTTTPIVEHFPEKTFAKLKMGPVA
jgi:hypothetical protein